MGDINSFGDWVKRRRQALGLTQDNLARRVGCAKATIRKIEADERRPSVQIAERLADVLALAAHDRAAFLQSARAEVAADRLPQPAQLPSAFPSGIVTFLVTDIEGSTPLWQEHPRTMPAALARHDALVRQAIATHRGVVFKTIGMPSARPLCARRTRLVRRWRRSGRCAELLGVRPARSRCGWPCTRA